MNYEEKLRRLEEMIAEKSIRQAIKAAEMVHLLEHTLLGPGEARYEDLEWYTESGKQVEIMAPYIRAIVKCEAKEPQEIHNELGLHEPDACIWARLASQNAVIICCYTAAAMRKALCDLGGEIYTKTIKVYYVQSGTTRNLKATQLFTHWKGIENDND